MNHEPAISDSRITNVEFGKDVEVIRPVNLYGCKIGDMSFVGPFTEIQRNVTIGRNCRIQSHSLICELVEVGDDCFIGHGVMFINDLFDENGPARGDKSKWKSTRVGDRVSIGSNATILPVKIADDTVIGAGSVVVHDIVEAGIYAGNPARLTRSISK